MMLQTISKKNLAFILFALSFLLFVRTIEFNRLWDDERVHFNATNQLLMKKDLGAFWTNHSGMYIPLTYTTWALVKKISPVENFWPSLHLLNVLTHSINGVLLFYLLMLLFKSQSIAFMGSLLFLIHPIQVEAVAWISEFRGLYSTFFCLLSLLFFFTEMEKRQHSTLTSYLLSKRYLFALFFFILALLAKPSAIVLPLLIVLLSWRFYRKNSMLVIKTVSIWIIPVIIDLFLLLIKNTGNDSTFWQRLLIAGYSFSFYLKKIMVPYPLVACYGYTPAMILLNPVSCVTLFLGVIIIFVLVLKRNAFPDFYTGCLFFIICLFPVSGFIPFEYQKHSNVADRYVYFAMSGFVFFIPAIEKWVVYKRGQTFLAGIAFIILCMLSIKQTNTWKNEFTLWDHTLKFYKNSPHTYYNRGVQYSLKGDHRNAVADYSAALALDPVYLDALFNRANAYENMNAFPLAFNDYSAYIKTNARDGSVYYKRSYLFYRTGQLDKAFDDLQKAEKFKFQVDRKYKKLLLETKFKNKQ